MNRKLYLGVLWSVTAVCIVIGLYVNLHWSRNYYEEEYAPAEEYSPEADPEVYVQEGMEPFTKVTVDGFLGEIIICAGDAYSCQYSPYSDQYPGEFSYEEDGIVVVQQRPQTNLKWSDGAGGSLYITVPYGEYLAGVDLTVDYGTVRLESINAETVTVTDRMGSVELHDCALAAADIQINMGDLNADMLQYTQFIANLEMGNAWVHTVNETSDGQIDLTTELGTISYNGEDNKGTSFGIYMGDSTASLIRIHNRMGNIGLSTDY